MKKETNVYRYELHCHSSEISPCGRLKAEKLAELYIRAGYSGIVLTDHFRKDLIESLPGKDWKEKRISMLEPYRRLKKRYENTDFWIGRGLELRFGTNENDFLLYGFAEELFLEEGERWPFMTLGEFYKAYKNQMLIIQAHPNRDEICFPESLEYLHGIEVKNTCPRHENHNDRSRKMADEYPRLIATGGSDCHRPEDAAGSGIGTVDLIRTDQELIQRLRAREYRIL